MEDDQRGERGKVKDVEGALSGGDADSRILRNLLSIGSETVLISRHPEAPQPVSLEFAGSEYSELLSWADKLSGPRCYMYFAASIHSVTCL